MNHFSEDDSDDESDDASAGAGDAVKCDVSKSKGHPAKASASAPGDKAGDADAEDLAEENEDVATQPVTFWSLFRYASVCDWLLIVFGLLCSAAVGVVQPLFAILFGSLLDSFGSADPAGAVGAISVQLVGIGAGAGLALFGQFALLGLVAERLTLRIRKQYVRALLRQPMQFWDDADPGTIASRIADDSMTISRGIGDQMGVAMQSVAAMIGGLVVGFYYNALLAVVVAAWIIPMAIPISILFSSRTSFQSITSDAFARATAVSSEALSSIRTVAAFGSEQAENRRFARHVGLAERVIAGSGMILGGAQGLFWIFIMLAYGTSLLFGATRIIESRTANPICGNAFLVATSAAGTEDCFSAGDVILVFFATLTGAFTAGQLGPAISAIASARIAARPIYDTIDRQSEIDPLSDAASEHGPATLASSSMESVPASASGGEAPASSVRPTTASGIEFVGVGFCYPSQPGVWVLRGFNLVVPRGETVALVGPSGSGKSSAMQLLLRYYDPQEGSIFLDGMDIRSMPVRELRAKIGFVQQQPRLFDTTVAENVALGIPEYKSDYGEASGIGIAKIPAAELARVEEALVAASASGFVAKLPSGLDTMVGAKGSTLSGGQRQRICIARAVVRRPALLCLDEATSALDTRSEAEVQAAIDKLLSAKAGSEAPLTAVVIAHRLATIRGADKIAVINAGKVEDEGTHAELVARGGRYAAMNDTQHLGTTTQDSDLDGHTEDDAAAAAAAGGAATLAGPAFVEEDRTAIEASSSAVELPTAVDDPAAAGTTTGATKDGVSLTTADASLKFAFKETPVLAALWERVKYERDDNEKAVILTGTSAEVLAFFNALHEMTRDELGAALTWWLGSQYDESKGSAADAIPAAMDWAPVITPPTKAMHAEALKDDIKMEDVPPKTEPRLLTLRLTPVKSRNRILGMVLVASVPTVSAWSVLDYQRPEWPIFALGTIGCAIAGSVFPVQSVVFAFVLDALYNPDDDVLLAEAGLGALLFASVGLAAAVGFVLQYGSFEFIGAKLTSRMRKQVYSAILRQDVSFHDYPSNSVGRLTARLATDAALIRRSTGERLGLVVQSATGLLLALGISFAASWQLTLVVIGLVPVLGVVGGLLTWALNNSSAVVKEALEGVTATTYEAAENIRTVASLGVESHIMGSVERSLEAPRAAAVRIAMTNGLAQGILQFIIFSSYGLVFWVGSVFIDLGILDQEALFRCFFVLAFSALSSANAAEFAGDQSKAESAKRAAFALFARRSKVDPQGDEGLIPATFEGKIEFRNVWFAYPARPEVYALKDLSFEILPGQQVGVCGESGSGKSTIIQLLLRFFDPTKGAVFLDGKDLREYNVRWLRSKMGLVQQQPELFSDNIMYNILYGNVPGASTAETKAESSNPAAAEEGRASRPGLIGNKPIAELGLGILADGSDQPEAVAAAKMAMAHRFIMRKPFRYASPAGSAGTPALSGGQAQRVAIARALIRDEASIFLADEATAALDSVSERKVQKALEHVVEASHEAGKKRTSIVIAHRLSTIKDSSKILVLDKGSLVEEGTHRRLISTKGSLYRDMAVKQDGASAME